jgi:hypothetical protein
VSVTVPLAGEEEGGKCLRRKKDGLVRKIKVSFLRGEEETKAWVFEMKLADGFCLSFELTAQSTQYDLQQQQRNHQTRPVRSSSIDT